MTAPGSSAARCGSTAGGHRVAGQPAAGFGHGIIEAGERLGVGPVAARAAGDRGLLRVSEQLEHPVNGGNRGGLQLGGHAAGLRQLVQVAEQAKAGDVGHPVRAGVPCRL